ncbi:MAG: glycerophosphodiester phosphodiesterase, partial [Chloroflexota bacterium]
MVWVVGQQGAAGILPGNTLKGFRHALSLGVDAVSCELGLSADGAPTLVRHVGPAADPLPPDPDLASNAGEGAPSFDDLLALVASAQAGLVCVLRERGAALPAAERVRARGLHEQVLLVSAHLAALAAIQRRDARLGLGVFLLAPTAKRIAHVVALSARQVVVPCDAVSLRLVVALHSGGLRLLA